MNPNILSNLDDIPAVQSFLTAQSSNDNIQSPLYQAQLDSNKYMAMKQRSPMVIEYIPAKDATPVSVEMYINPSRLNISTQKIKGKSVTRGGIFYHHWGDDHLTMQLSGTTGLAGMKGLQQIEQIYAYSGTLLHYTDVGSTKVPGQVPEFELIQNGDPFGGLNYIMENSVSEDTISTISNSYSYQIAKQQHSMSKSQEQVSLYNTTLAKLNQNLIINYQNTVSTAKGIASYQQIYNNLLQYISNNRSLNSQHVSSSVLFQEAQKEMSVYFPNLNPILQSMLSQELSNAAFSGYSNPNYDLNYIQQSTLGLGSGALYRLNAASSDYMGNFTNNNLPIETVHNQISSMGKSRMKALKSYVQEVQDYNVRNRVSNSDAAKGFQDINDELNDEWRPRQIFIYFEDRVYLGHFDSFAYQRSAEAPLVNYDMRFTVTRQIIVTSNDSSSVSIGSTDQTDSTSQGRTIQLAHGNYVVYDNGPNGWTLYNSLGTALSSGVAPTWDTSAAYSEDSYIPGTAIKLANGNVVIYDNGPNGWTEYDSSHRSVASGVAPTWK